MMFSSSCLFLGRLIYNQKKEKPFICAVQLKEGSFCMWIHWRPKVLKSGRGKPYVAALIGKQLKVLVRETLKFIVQRHEGFTVNKGGTSSNANTLCYKHWLCKVYSPRFHVCLLCILSYLHPHFLLQILSSLSISH